ncbi:sensor histidine kinase [Spirosoma soli]|uniref:histidine kinase n=1 Tax=Spirosoma soli TaxID=1770529 RepID=A0ABW5M0D1_9BACT
MTQASSSSIPLEPDLATYLFARREAILDTWRVACEQDSMLRTLPMLSREEFNDMIPTILNGLTQRLRNEPEKTEPLLLASEHGLHRWHKGYTLRQLIREVKHLRGVLSGELQTYEELYPAADPKLIYKAYHAFAELNEDIIEGSVARYDELERASATARANTLQEALDSVNELARQRTDMLRTSSHDLRSSLGIIQGAAFMLDLENQKPQERTRLIDMLNRNLTNVQVMLQNLMSLARLDAGQENPDISRFNVAELLRELTQSAEPIAADRGLTLMGDGVEELIVESDGLKVRRIVQNLLMNALLYTQSGVVSVSWGKEDDYRWTVSVQDSGPGLPGEVVEAIAGKLSPSTEASSVYEAKPLEEPPIEEAPAHTKKSNESQGHGEGIGLHIVKRLCELLEANLDVETSPQGTLIRVRFPIHFK